MQEQRKASNTTTSDIVLESLREQIINGTLQPQEKLVEAEIAQKFGLSRGPVREALRQLAVHADETFHQQIIRSAQLDRLTKMWELLSPLNGAMFLSVQNANHFGQLSGDAETLQNAKSL